MKQEFMTLMKKLGEWKAFAIQKAKDYSQEWFGQAIEAQNNCYQTAHDWVEGRLPAVTSRYDKSPHWFKRGLFYLPGFACS